MRDDDGRLQPARRRLDVVQHAVDAVADLQLVLERLDVDVRRALLDGAVDEHVHQPDDRRLAGEVAQVVDVLFVVGEELEIAVAVLPRTVLPVARAVAVRRLEPLQHVALARQARVDVEPRRHLEPLQRVLVAGIGHRDRQRAVLLRERQHLRAPQVLQVQLAERHRLAGEVASRRPTSPRGRRPGAAAGPPRR